jgi:hypothetical protein
MKSLIGSLPLRALQLLTGSDEDVQLVYDDWLGVLPNETVIEKPDWTEVEAAIRNMDGRARCTVTIERDDWSNLSIGGGGASFNVCHTTPDEHFWQSIIPTESSSQMVGLVVGGQLGEYPPCAVVDIDTALAAAKEFLATGQRDTRIHWERMV